MMTAVPSTRQNALATPDRNRIASHAENDSIAAPASVVAALAMMAATSQRPRSERCATPAATSAPSR